jgi:hypothetical protein
MVAFTMVTVPNSNFYSSVLTMNFLSKYVTIVVLVSGVYFLSMADEKMAKMIIFHYRQRQFAINHQIISQSICDGHLHRIMYRISFRFLIIAEIVSNGPLTSV